ncbi:MAG: sugar phosphate isomerase/epimerase family protein [Candidatus Cyclobacteriaceae bacterium M3_2C_046]
MKTQNYSRRNFIKSVSAGSALAMMPWMVSAESMKKSKMKLGLVTYLWAKDWDLPTLISNCEKSNVLGVELRVNHAHGVMPDLSKSQRAEVKKMFTDSPVEVLGPGTNQEYHSPDPAELKKQIEGTKEFIVLSHDIGGTGVKVKPNAFPEGVSKQKTIEQIGLALDEVGQFARDYGQEIRVEVHGRETQRLPNIKAMMDVADNKNVKVCWNCNNEDLSGQGLTYNFNLVKDKFGDTVHIRELNVGDYPYQDLMNLFVANNYKGWILLEARTDPADKVKALIEQRGIFEEMVAKALKSS